jgi:CRISPR-associated protein Cmr3
MDSIPFQHLISLEPLGLLYGSSGRFLSAENLTGLAGEHFPPDSPAFAGLVAGQLSRDRVRDLHTAGPFWFRLDEDELDPRLPAPLTLLQKAGGTVAARLTWQPDAGAWQPDSDCGPKPATGGWVRLSQWGQWSSPDLKVEANPWQATPHLHPRLEEDQRVSAQEAALFLELAIALEPGVALAYLSSEAIPEGCYRFGGEGHLVQLRCHPIPAPLVELLQAPQGFSSDQPLALVTPGVWGSRKLSMREPLDTARTPAIHPWRTHQQGPAILTDRPRPWRFRLGRGAGGQASRRLSRGRWCLPAGSCYALPEGLHLPAWAGWPESWFPSEGFSFRHFGTGLALPLYGLPSG